MDKITPCCPTCGAGLVDQFAWDFPSGTFMAGGAAVRFTMRQSMIFDAIWRTRRVGGVANTDRLTDVAYIDEPNGATRNTTHVHLWKMRKMMEPTGFTISYSAGRPRTGYRIEKAAAA